MITRRNFLARSMEAVIGGCTAARPAAEQVRPQEAVREQIMRQFSDLLPFARHARELVDNTENYQRLTQAKLTYYTVTEPLEELASGKELVKAAAIYEKLAGEFPAIHSPVALHLYARPNSHFSFSFEGHIFLYAPLVRGLREEICTALVAHELAHLERHDAVTETEIVNHFKEMRFPGRASEIEHIKTVRQERDLLTQLEARADITASLALLPLRGKRAFSDMDALINYCRAFAARERRAIDLSEIYDRKYKLQQNKRAVVAFDSYPLPNA